MKKAIIITVSVILSIILLLVAVLLFVGKSNFTFVKGDSAEKEYVNIMGASELAQTARVVDIAMLGAHDAFSDKITTKSKGNPEELEDSFIGNKTFLAFADGIVTRLSRAQVSSAETLLKKGVRYFDVRIAYANNEYFTTHAFLSDKLEVYLKEVIAFLASNPSEFIIFDIQHAYLGDKTFEDLFNYIESVKVDGRSLLSFVNYDPATIGLGALTYGDVTANGAGAVILAKTEQTETMRYHYVYKDSIRSYWHEKNVKSELIKGIESEYANLTANASEYKDMLRVNQAQLTGTFGGDTIFNTILGWSLIDMANGMNIELIKHANFKEWFKAMPILMVDYADCPSSNATMNNAVIEYNKGLK